MAQARLKLEGVPAPHLHMVWDTVKPMLTECINLTNGEYSIEDTQRNILERDWQLWLGIDSEDYARSVAVTEIAHYPRRKICRVVLVQAEEMRFISELLDDLAAWALSIQCTGMEAWCRPGMAKVLVKNHEFIAKYQVVTKDLKRSVH